MTFNTVSSRINAAVAGFGLTFLPEDTAAGLVEEGKPESVLEDWYAPFAGIIFIIRAVSSIPPPLPN